MLSRRTIAYIRGMDASEAERKIGQRKSAGLRREEILEAAIRLIAQKGFAAVTLRDVAAEVGVAHGLLRHYFDSRDELIASAFDRAVTEELDSWAGLKAHPDADDLLRAVAGWLTATPRDHYLVWIDAWSEAPRNPALHASLRRHHVDCEQRLARVIERGVTGGVFSIGDDAASVSRILTAYADGLAVQQHAIGTIDDAEYNALVFAMAERMLGLERGRLAAVISP